MTTEFARHDLAQNSKQHKRTRPSAGDPRRRRVLPARHRPRGDRPSGWSPSTQLLERSGPARARYLMLRLLERAGEQRVAIPALTSTDYVNTIPTELEPWFPGDEDVERRYRAWIRWNAAIMVHRAQRPGVGVGGHISTYASSAALYEVGFNHFFRGKSHPGGGDQVFIQGHASPGIYARAFLEGRLTADQLDGFRQEHSHPGGGLPSYPHPRLMPDFWEFPTVSMGLGPMNAIYQARFNHYLHDRGIKDTSDQHVWAFLGDGEMDEPESRGLIQVGAQRGPGQPDLRRQLQPAAPRRPGARQRQDHPGAGVVLPRRRLERHQGGVGPRMGRAAARRPRRRPGEPDEHHPRRRLPDLQGQRRRPTCATTSSAATRAPRRWSRPMTDRRDLEPQARRPRLPQGLRRLPRRRSSTRASRRSSWPRPSRATRWAQHFEGRNATHQMKKLALQDLKDFRDAMRIPISDAQLEENPYLPPYYHPGPDAPEIRYLLDRRRALGGFLPERRTKTKALTLPGRDTYKALKKGSGNQEVATTMATVRTFKELLRDKEIGPRIVPIIPDEARTFGMDSWFPSLKIYNRNGQLYTAVDAELMLAYKESEVGQILHEGINEAGSTASFTAVGTSYATHNEPMIPIYIFYSMFGFQRTGDGLWAAADQMARGFVLGATAGRTTLTGEGLQHADGHSLLLAATNPAVVSYDPAFAYEIAYIIESGLARMFGENPENVYFYITIYNEPYVQPAEPENFDPEGAAARHLPLPAGHRAAAPTPRRSWPPGWRCPRRCGPPTCWPPNGTSPPTCGR